jgi:hypothetical protein
MEGICGDFVTFFCVMRFIILCEIFQVMEDCEVAVRSIEEVERDVEALTKQLSVLSLEAEDLERNTSFDLLVLIVLDAVIVVLLALRYEICLVRG